MICLALYMKFVMLRKRNHCNILLHPLFSFCLLQVILLTWKRHWVALGLSHGCLHVYCVMLILFQDHYDFVKIEFFANCYNVTNSFNGGITFNSVNKHLDSFPKNRQTTHIATHNRRTTPPPAVRSPSWLS